MSADPTPLRAAPDLYCATCLANGDMVPALVMVIGTSYCETHGTQRVREAWESQAKLDGLRERHAREELEAENRARRRRWFKGPRGPRPV